MSLKAYLKPQHRDVKTRDCESYEMGTDTGLCVNMKNMYALFPAEPKQVMHLKLHIFCTCLHHFVSSLLVLRQVSPQEMVQEIHQVLMDREDTCHRTCFSLQLDGNVLDNFAELKSIEGLQEGSLLKVVEGETQSEAFVHTRACLAPVAQRGRVKATQKTWCSAFKFHAFLKVVCWGCTYSCRL